MKPHDSGREKAGVYTGMPMGAFLVPVLLSFFGHLGAQENEFDWEEEVLISDGRTSLNGYGELHYNSRKTGAGVPDSGDLAQMDFHRMVIGLSHNFSDRISLHVEVDFEHAASELELELAYIDFLVRPEFNFRAGSVLMPVGPLNEFHEPTLFFSVERPYVQTYIIPTTWNGGGAGIFGSLQSGFRYRFYIVPGLDASGFSGSQGIRGGRGKVVKEPSEDLAVVGRLQYINIPGVDIGFSFYRGNTGQGEPGLRDTTAGILEGDFRLKHEGFDLRAVIARIDLGGADRISDFTGETIGDAMFGWYVEGAYDLLQLHPSHVTGSLFAFLRFESFDTHHSVAEGFTANPEYDRDIISGGLAFYPHQEIAIKADLERWEDKTERSGTRFNLATAYQF